MYKDETWLHTKYVECGLSSYAIAKEAGCSAPTVRTWLKRYGIEIRKRSDYLKDGIMEESNVITLCNKCHGKTKKCEYVFSDKYLAMVSGEV